MALNISALAGPGGQGSNLANPATTLAVQPVSSSQDSLTQFMRSMQNIMGQQGGNLVQQGGAAMGPAIAQLQKLSGGDPAAVNEATQNEQDQITEAFSRTRQMISTMPRGGGTASAEVTAPYKGIKDIAEVKSKARGDATGKLADVGTTLAGLGLEGEKAAASNALTERGLDQSGSFANNFASIASGIGALI
jgi:cellobiose-specific phosphotransferase system component IIA